MKTVLVIGACLGLALCAVACDSGYQQAQPQIVQQEYPVQGVEPPYPNPAPIIVEHNHDGLIAGLIIGHALSSGGSHTTVINRTYVAPRTVYRSTPSYSRGFSSRRR